MSDGQSVLKRELEDLSGLIADVAGKVQRDEPGLAGEVAKALHASANYFEFLDAMSRGEVVHVSG